MTLRLITDVDSPDGSVEALLDRLRPIISNRHYAGQVADLLHQLRTAANGQYPALLRTLRPDLRRPDAWAARLMRRIQTSAADAPVPGYLLPAGDATSAADHARHSSCRWSDGGDQESGVLPDAPSGRSPGDALAGRPLDDRAAALYPRLRPLLALSRTDRRQAIRSLAGDLGMSETNIYRLLRRLRHTNGSAAALNRRPRTDRGKVRLPAEVQQMFLRRRLDPMTRHESVQISIDITRREFPAVDVSQFSLRQLERRLPRAIQMRDQEWRARYLSAAGGQWEVPHINHTWTFDMSQADLFVWDGRPDHRPYRPSVLAIVDEASQCCLYMMYTEESPSVGTLAACLLHAMLPKSLDWPMCGVPLHLHADNGKIQCSGWLAGVCEQLGREIDLCQDLRRSQVRSPWMDGHIESFFHILHHRLEPQLAGYCGPNINEKPECYPNIDKPRREDYLALEDLNEVARVWIPTEYHGELQHARLHQTRAEYWRANAGSHVRLPDETYLRHVLMQKVSRRTSRGQIRMFNATYWHERLMSYDGMSLPCRYDVADLTRLLVIPTHGEPFWADRMEPQSVDNPADYAGLQKRRRRLRDERRLQQETAETLAGGTEADRERFMSQLRSAQASAPIPFPGRPVRVDPAPPPDDSDLDALAEAAALSPSPPGRGDGGEGPLTLHGIEI